MRPGKSVIQQGTQNGRFFFLIEGKVEVLKNDVPVAITSQPGAVFGEMAALLNCPHTTTVRAEAPCAFYSVEEPRKFLREHPEVCLHICELLARRLDSLTRYLVDVKHQFEGHDHLGMVNQVLEALLNRHPRPRVRPSESTVRAGELHIHIQGRTQVQQVAANHDRVKLRRVRQQPVELLQRIM